MESRRDSVQTGDRTQVRPPVGGHIRGLDGLRGIAVLAVVAFHLAPWWLAGGFLGVDLFFVISGFLITTLLVREVVTRRRLDIPRFWLRRARRLLPALFLVIVVAVPVARFVEPDLTVGIGRQALGAATFSTNWVEIAAGTDYFDETAPELLRPLWSLAIEEQFYLLWPIALVFLLAAVRRATSRARVVLAAALASAGLMALLLDADPTRVYYGTDTHAFGLLLGAALALRRPRAGPLLAGRWARVVPVLALIALGALFVVLPSAAPSAYRGGLLLATLLSVLLVAACAGPVTWFVRALELPPLAWVGVRSYGIYLWHWPVLLVVAAVLPAEPGTARWWTAAAVAVAATFAISAASYRFVEVPVRTLGFRGAWRELAAAVRRVAPAGPMPSAGRDGVTIGARAAVGAAVVAVVATGVAIATAPDRSGAEIAVAQGVAAAEAGKSTGQSRAAGGTSPAGSGERRTAPSPSAPAAAPGTEPGAEPSGTAEPSGRPDRSQDDGADVSGFGDSVLAAAAPALLDRYPDADVDGVPIRTWLDAPALVEKAAEKGTLRDRVVLNFGTNGGFQYAGSLTAARRTLDLIGPERTVVLVNIVGVSYWVPDANAQLAKLAKKYPNVAVADWHSVVADRPGLLHADRTHPNMEGIEVYTRLVERTFARLAGR